VREGVVDLDLAALGLTPPPDADAVFAANDLLTGAVYAWGAQPYVRLDPLGQVAHILAVATS